MTDTQLTFTLWDVGHGISIWVQTPSGANHWIDLGKTSDFSPSEYVHRRYGVEEIDYLIISHPDQDHLEDLPNFKASFGDPRVLHRNKSLPEQEMFGERGFQYQRDFQDFHKRFSSPILENVDPGNSEYNGGVTYAVHSLNHGIRTKRADLLGGPTIEGNNTSIVVMLLYKGILFVCPGDIEPLGWQELWEEYGKSYNDLINNAYCRFLVAPHHGRKSGYCREIMDAIRPHATLISDVWGASETHPYFRTEPTGIKLNTGELKKYYSTKRSGRVRIVASSDGFTVDQYDQ